MALLLRELVDVGLAVRAAPGRRDKVTLLADLLRIAGPDAAEATVGLLLGRIRQGRIGLGWRTLAAAREAVDGTIAPGDGEPPHHGEPPAYGEPPGDGQPPAYPLAVLDVDAALTRIAALTGPGSTDPRRLEIESLLRAASSAERDFLTHALLGDVRTGALDGVLTDALATAIGRPLAEVRRAVMLTGDLGRTAALGLRDPNALAATRLAVGTPVQPMLASTAPDVAAALAITGPASVEHKLDGARIQVHRTGDSVTVHTRSLADVTDRVPEIVAFVRNLDGDHLILDGETLMLDDSGTPRPFQETMSRFGCLAESDGGESRASAPTLAPRFFDLLALDGVDITGRPLAERRAALADLVGPAHLIPGIVTDDPEAAAGVLAEALGLGHEGVLVKAIDSPYAAGRRGKSWVKVKPVHTLDLVVLAAEWGYGRRTGWLSNLHLGARDLDGAYGPAGGFVMVGKTFKGLTDEILRWQTQTFPSYAVRSTPGVEWLRPELVVEIAIDGVQRSSRYPGGVALRFARVKQHRDDKPAAEADTIETLRALLRD